MLISDDAALMTARKSSCPAIARKIDRICAISIERGSLLMAPYPPPTLQRFPFIWDHPVIPYERKRRRLHCAWRMSLSANRITLRLDTLSHILPGSSAGIRAVLRE